MNEIAILQALYEGDHFENFMDFFVQCYTKADTAKRLALLLHFSCEWHMAETCELPRQLIEIE